MDTVALFNWVYDYLNYWTIMLMMAIESSFIPFPSEVVIPPAAYKAAGGEMNVVAVVLSGTLGADIGAIINYYLARFLGRPIVYAFANSRIGHMCLIDEAKVRKAENYFAEHGALSTFVGRLVPAVRQLISIPAGIARMSFSKFILYTTLGAMAWNTVLAAIGYYLYGIVGDKEALLKQISIYNSQIGYAMFALGAFVIAYLVYQGMRPKK
ncbi:MAG: DedA family protein [Bacteroidaceae bacterium]|nr:DedA family protein [Bacteroidaceae bacterium]